MVLPLMWSALGDEVPPRRQAEVDVAAFEGIQKTGCLVADLFLKSTSYTFKIQSVPSPGDPLIHTANLIWKPDRRSKKDQGPVRHEPSKISKS